MQRDRMGPWKRDLVGEDGRDARDVQHVRRTRDLARVITDDVSVVEAALQQVPLKAPVGLPLLRILSAVL